MADSDSIKLCECGCGNPAPIATSTHRKYGWFKGRPKRFINGHARISHGHSMNGRSSQAHKAWKAMKQRCNNPNDAVWKYYGGRGIKVCDRWLNSFENFLSDMGTPPPGMSLDRYPDQNGDYEPGNCRWATVKQQLRNRRNVKMITAFGETKTMREWSLDPRCNISYSSIMYRLSRNWPNEQAIQAPPKWSVNN